LPLNSVDPMGIFREKNMYRTNVQILWGFGEVLMEVSSWIDVYIQLMVDGWFGAR